MPENRISKPLTITQVPWVPLERSEFDAKLNEETAAKLWAEVSKIKERQPDDAQGWRCRFSPRPDLGGLKCEVEWQTRRIVPKANDLGKWSPNTWFYVATDDQLKPRD
jgi:hypothetical protein